jgi:hypothetical protein
MSVLTRKEYAHGIEAQLRALGPQTVAQIREDLGLTKRDAEDAIWYLMSMNRIEYAGTFPIVYRIAK